MIQEALRQLVYSAAAVGAIVGGTSSTARIYPMMVPRTGTYPCLVYQEISVVRTNHLRGSSGLTTRRFQFTAWAETSTAARTLSEALREALDQRGGVTVGGVVITYIALADERDTFDLSPDLEGREMFGRQLDFMVTHHESQPNTP